MSRSLVPLTALFAAVFHAGLSAQPMAPAGMGADRALAKPQQAAGKDGPGLGLPKEKPAAKGGKGDGGTVMLQVKEACPSGPAPAPSGATGRNKTEVKGVPCPSPAPAPAGKAGGKN